VEFGQKLCSLRPLSLPAAAGERFRSYLLFSSLLILVSEAHATPVRSASRRTRPWRARTSRAVFGAFAEHVFRNHFSTEMSDFFKV
jgi:hypothetical protein